MRDRKHVCAHDGQWGRNARHGDGITRRSRCQRFRTAHAAVDIKRPAWQSMGNSGCVCVCVNEHRNKAKGSVSSQSVRPCLSRCKLAARSSTALAMPAMQNETRAVWCAVDRACINHSQRHRVWDTRGTLRQPTDRTLLSRHKWSPLCRSNIL